MATKLFKQQVNDDLTFGGRALILSALRDLNMALCDLLKALIVSLRSLFVKKRVAFPAVDSQVGVAVGLLRIAVPDVSASAAQLASAASYWLLSSGKADDKDLTRECGFVIRELNEHIARSAGKLTDNYAPITLATEAMCKIHYLINGIGILRSDAGTHATEKTSAQETVPDDVEVKCAACAEPIRPGEKCTVTKYGLLVHDTPICRDSIGE